MMKIRELKKWTEEIEKTEKTKKKQKGLNTSWVSSSNISSSSSIRS